MAITALSLPAIVLSHDVGNLPLVFDKKELFLSVVGFVCWDPIIIVMFCHKIFLISNNYING
ncbi:uncharacterized protein DS421_11g333220 [Arachis hypogaea]|nr:uncharacterized protein DS421_11g333220 [Arachis hypogaea]